MAAGTSTVHQDNSLALATSWEDLLEVLSQPDPLADLIIDVEGHQLHTSKYLLASASPKFRQIFSDPAAENTNILPLTGVSLRATVDLLRWLLPTHSSGIQEETLEVLLQLACDYNMEELHKECDRYVMNKLGMSDQHENHLHYLALAEQFGLTDAFEHAVELLSPLTMKELTSLEHLSDIKSSTLCQIMRKHTEEFEDRDCSYGNVSVLETTTLVVDDREIEVSTAALVTASDVFKAMITSDFLERKTGRITLPGKSYDGVEFMVNYITSQHYVPIAGGLLAECVDLAEEYMLGHLKLACCEYMISEAEQADLNDCLFYLRLAHKYQLSDVENKVLQVIYKRSTSDILACTNYDITFAATLMLKHAQWLEDELRQYKKNITIVAPRLNQLMKHIRIEMAALFGSLHQAVTYSNGKQASCGNGHSLSKGASFNENCLWCSVRSKTQIKEELSIIRDKPPILEPSGLLLSFFGECDTQVSKLKQDLVI